MSTHHNFPVFPEDKTAMINKRRWLSFCVTLTVVLAVVPISTTEAQSFFHATTIKRANLNSGPETTLAPPLISINTDITQTLHTQSKGIFFFFLNLQFGQFGN